MAKRSETPGKASVPAPETYAAWMGQALDLAAATAGAEDVPVGALVVAPDGRVVGRGHNVREELGDPTGHAEVVALREAAGAAGLVAAGRLHARRDARAVRHVRRRGDAARVERVVFGAWDPKAGACGSVWDLTRDRRSRRTWWTSSGVCARRSRRPSWSISSRDAGSGKVSPGGVSERPKEHASKACVGVTPPWVQIPPPPPVTCRNAGPSLKARTGVSRDGLIRGSHPVVVRPANCSFATARPRPHASVSIRAIVQRRSLLAPERGTPGRRQSGRRGADLRKRLYPTTGPATTGDIDGGSGQGRNRPLIDGQLAAEAPSLVLCPSVPVAVVFGLSAPSSRKPR